VLDDGLQTEQSWEDGCLAGLIVASDSEVLSATSPSGFQAATFCSEYSW